MSNGNRGSFGDLEPSSAYSTYQAGFTGRDSSNDFTRLSQLIGNNIQKLSQNVFQMQSHISQIGTSQDTAELRDKLHHVQHYTNQLAKETNKYLKDLASLPAPATQSEQRQQKLQRERLVSEFTASLNSLQGAQREAAEKERESVASARAHSSSRIDPVPNGSNKQLGVPAHFSDEANTDDRIVPNENPTGQQGMQMQEDADLQLLQEREQAVRKLESDIVAVNTIFTDLGLLVHEQQDVFDSIEANVETAQIHVEQGTQELSKAKDYQSKARKRKCVIILIVLIVVIVLVTILAVVLSNL